MLKITHLKKVFSAGTPNEHVALKDLSLEVSQGEFICLLGSNGAGKSTLFNAISGLFWVDSGSIFLDNKNITYDPEHKRSATIGRLFQDPMMGTAPHMTIEENLALTYSRARRRGLRLAVQKKESLFFRDSLAEFNMGLEDRMNTNVGLLSGGQRQALTLLMSTIVPPKLLLLDEHTAALDPTTAEKVMLITKDIVKKHNLTTLMITHNMQSAINSGTRTLMLDRGEIILDIQGKEREELTVPKLIDLFAKTQNKAFDNDRMLLGS